MNKYLTILLLSAAIIRADEIVVLPAVETTASSVTGELSIKNPINALGDGGDLLNTPRMVSTIDAFTLDKFNISTIGQISSYVADAQTFGSYGQSSNINVRGDMSEQYMNNERRTNNAFGFYQSFNAIESVDVVHGAPSVVFGPGFYSGGYTDFQTKQASFDDFTKITLTLGTWAPAGNSFLNTSGIVDQNFVINDTTAIRISYEAQKDQTFYYRNGGRNDAQDIYFTLKKIFNRRLSLDINLEFSWQSAPELIGVNRVTQDLIWRNEYITGKTSNVYDMSLMPNGPVEILKSTDTVLSMGDFSNSDTLFSQFILVDKLNSISTLKNYTMFEYVNRRRFNQYEYAEYSTQYTFDNRTELHFDIPNELYTILGLNERYEYRDTYIGYDNTFFESHDVTNGVVHASIDYPEYFIGFIGPGGRNFFDVSQNDYDTTKSRVYSISPFWQQRFYFTNDFQFLFGARADAYRAFVQDPLNDSISDNVTTVSNSTTASLLYILNRWSFYTTAGRIAALNGSVTGGGICLDPNNKINVSDFRSLNKLYEVGTRYESKTFSASLTGFLQWREQHDFYTDANDFVYARGVELEMKWKPNANWFFIGNLTYLEDNFVNSLPFEFSGIGLPAASVSGNYRVPGLSRLSLNQTIGYKLTRHIEASMSLRWQNSQEGDALSSYHIPSEYDLEASIAYLYKNYSISLTGDNLTNQINFIHNGDEYGDNVLISKALPINFFLVFKYRL